MPARTCAIGLVSTVSINHPIPLKLVDSHNNWGSDWSSGGSPPSIISRDSSSDPGVGSWQTETKAFPLAGTGGYVTYEIQDDGCQFQFESGEFRMGYQNQFTIHFGNPTFGPPTEPTWDWTVEGDIYNLSIIGVTSGGQDQIPDLLAGPPFWIGAVFSGEIDNPLFVLQLTLQDEMNTTVVCSTRAALRGKDLSAGVRALQPPGTASMRSLLWNYVA